MDQVDGPDDRLLGRGREAGNGERDLHIGDDDGAGQDDGDQGERCGRVPEDSAAWARHRPISVRKAPSVS